MLILATPAVAAAIPVKPNMAATKEIINNVMAKLNIWTSII